jgi:hypothetical protein
MVEEAVKRYRVAYERDKSGWWASVRGVHGCHTQGRTVDEARRHIRGAWVKLPSAAARVIRAYATLRKKADEKTDGPPSRLDAPSASCEPEN